MTIQQWLALAQTSLQSSGITTARLDALILLEDATSKDRAWLLAYDDQMLTNQQLDILADNLERRLQREPLAYIRGFQEFYGRQFMVNAEVLVPRPESEAMITLLLRHVGSGSRIADVGTGSGALAITAALETDAVVAALDIDEACLDVARRNAVMHNAAIDCIQSDLLAAIGDWKPDILLANLPYVPDDYPINDAAQHEPRLALFAGADGLDLYRRLFIESSAPQLITEAMPQQHASLEAIAMSHGYRLLGTEGYAQLFMR